MTRRVGVLTCAIVAVTLGVAAGQTLDRRLQTALDASDLDAVVALAELRDSSDDVWFTIMDLVSECSFEMKCVVSTGPVDAAFKESQSANAREGIEFPAPVQGLVIVTMTSSSGKGRTTMPYGQVGGQPKILGGRYTAAKLAEQRGKATQAVVDELLASGIGDATGERRTDWKTAARPLPAGGGEFGKLLQQRIGAMQAAVKARDPDAAVAAGDARDARVYGAKRYDGVAIPIATRRHKLRAQSARFLTEVRVLGGYQLGDQAVLTIEGVNGVGWVERGALVVRKADGGWETVTAYTVSHPK